MRLTSLQTIGPLLLKGLDKTTIFHAGPQLELEPILDGDRRDVLIRRPGYEDTLVWQENVACATVESARPEPGEAAGAAVAKPEHACPLCERSFVSAKALQVHERRTHHVVHNP